MHTHRFLAAMALALLAVLAPSAARAAQGYDNCTGFIDTLPATITTQGTWCLRKDLSTAQATGAAITITTNNVTIDCNDFKIGGLAAGPQSQASGIRADNRLNATVRRCNLRGFYSAITLIGSGSGGHLVEDNRVEASLRYGLSVEGDGTRVQRNLVRDTGGTGVALGVRTKGQVDVLDNTIAGVAPQASGGAPASAVGIQTYENDGGVVRGNRVRGLAPLDGGLGYGIQNILNGRVLVQDNLLVGSGAGSYGFTCDSKQGRMLGNIVNGFGPGDDGCRHEQGGNDYTP